MMHHQSEPTLGVTPHKSNILVQVIEGIIFQSRWILAPLYIGLILGMVLYCLKFVVELVHLVSHFRELTESEMMVGVLGLLDVTMVGNLVLMVLIGGYSSFVKKIEFGEKTDRPQGFSKLNSGMLKVKMGMSLIGVSSIHLLKIFTEIVGQIGKHDYPFPWAPLIGALMIHMTFVISTIGMAKTDRIMHVGGDHHEE